jgi:hypothetical protein
MKKIILLVFVTLFTSIAFSAPVKRQFRDMKLATQQLIERQYIENPAAAGTTDILSADAGIIDTNAVTISTFVAQPDVTRAVQFTIGGTAADIGTCTATVNGTDFHGQVISEDFSVTANTAETLQGSKAFKTITSISLPAACEDSPYGATWSVGYSEKLGLKRCLAQAGHVVFSTVAGAYEATRATVANDAANIEGNTADFNGTMDGANDFEIFFFQNFAQSCFP